MMRCLALVVVSIILLPCISAYSSGDVQVCNAYGDWGCPNNDWELTSTGTIDRLNCNNTIGSIMDWVAQPVRSDAYSVRTGDNPDAKDPTSYGAGELMRIYVRVVDYEFKFRGIMLYAVNSNGATVGSWEFPKSASSPMFWVPPDCPNHLLHSTAARKPFSNIMYFRAPPKGTGTITFHCLIKKGPANHGYFYYPMQKDLTLTESSSYRQTWFKSKKGQSCTARCAEESLPCDLNTMKMANSADGFESGVSRQYICNFPTLASCADFAPTSSSQDTCYYHDSNCAAWRNKNNPGEVTCESSSNDDNNGYRLCVCGDGSKDPSNPSNKNNPNHPDWDPSANAGARSGPNTILTVQLLAGLIAWLGGRRSSYIMVTTLILFVFIGSCDAHNWMHTPGRAYTLASTIKPCLGRKSTDTHAQIKSGQEFSVQFATGHSRDSWFLVLHVDDAHHMGDPDLVKIMEDYITNDPAAASQEWLKNGKMRYHGASPGRYSGPTSDYATGTDGTKFRYNNILDQKSGLYDQLAHPGAKHRGTDPSGQNQTVWQYNADYLQNDRRVSYVSAKYPWLESVYRYKHLHHLAVDWDGFLMTVPARKGPGHYIVHWRWSGYYDCFDIDVRAQNVPNIYGTISPGAIWNRVDHCQYIKPKDIRTDCYQSPIDADYCKKVISSDMNRRYGINVVPLHNPATVYPKYRFLSNIPWSHPNCVSSWTRLAGKVTESPFNMGDWRRHYDLKSNSLCTSVLSASNSNPITNRLVSLKQAVVYCATLSTCKGIAWEKNGAPIDRGLHTFDICLSTGVKTNTTWIAYFKLAATSRTAISNPFTIKISFQPPMCDSPRNPVRTGERTCLDKEITLPSGYYPDTGAVYGTRTGGYEYGWNCDRYKRDTVSNRGGLWMRVGDQEKGSQMRTWVRDIHCTCNPYICASDDNKNKNRSRWEIKVPNGVYQVKSIHARRVTSTDTIRVRGCTVENIPMTYEDIEFPNPSTFTQEVEVTDGHLTLAGKYRNGVDFDCNALSSLEISMVDSAWPEAFAPKSTNPWWQKELDTFHPIGLVQFQRANYRNCSSWWPYTGNKCPPPETSDPRSDCKNSPCRTPKGWFDRDEKNTGMIVGVSNRSCSGTSCSGIVCDRVDWSNPSTDWLRVDCKGVWGKYVYLQAPGSNRIISFQKIEVHRAVGIGQPDDFVCYGVEARLQTATEPEYEVVLDPEDPIFYSTCYVREKNISFIDIAYPPAKSPWHFNRKCIDCYNHKRNSVFNNDVTLTTMRWEVTDKCMDCDAETIVLPTVKKSMVLVYNKSYCIERDACDKEDPITIKYKKSVSNHRCVKELTMKGRGRGSTMSNAECGRMASLDPECSNIVMQYIDKRYCRCYLKRSCCGECTPYVRKSYYRSWNIYEVAPTAPATNCSAVGGKLSNDGKMCCSASSSCVYKGTNVCGLEMKSPYRCAGSPVIGSCCKTDLQKCCSTHGPPCMMTC